MTNQEINEYLAERLFGLKRGVDFDFMWNVPKIREDAPDHTKDYQSVLEAMIAKGLDVTISYDKEYKFNVTFAGMTMEETVTSIGATLGEAVCRAAVEWLEEEGITIK